MTGVNTKCWDEKVIKIQSCAEIVKIQNGNYFFLPKVKPVC